MLVAVFSTEILGRIVCKVSIEAGPTGMTQVGSVRCYTEQSFLNCVGDSHCYMEKLRMLRLDKHVERIEKTKLHIEF
jgi:hypothetical protein